MHWMRANWRVDRARERAGERGLADARIVLDEDVALGQHRDDDVLEHLVADLDGALDVLLDAPRDGGGLLGPPRAPSVPEGWGSTGSISSATLTREDERRLNTLSSMAPAIAALDACGTCCSPSRGDDRDLVVGGVEADARRARRR